MSSIEDRFLPSLDEARRLTKTLPHCTHRKLEQTCHCILLVSSTTGCSAVILRLTCLHTEATVISCTADTQLLFQGEDFDLASTIKKTGMYHRAATKDPVADFVLPTEEEIEKLYDSQR